MSKILNLLRMIILGMLVITSVPLTIAYFGDIERQQEIIVVLHVIFGILFILVAIPITLRERRLQQKSK
jgi:threonine/homoserine/homoserine lactone efflux protein